ncbi:MAG: Fis family transcriptional regulator [Leptolyngbya sp.]|nr:MAG: Fis family transcriptional regulator [Leptolyngbya sp.]
MNRHSGFFRASLILSLLLGGSAAMPLPALSQPSEPLPSNRHDPRQLEANRLFTIGLDHFARAIGLAPFPLPQRDDDVSPPLPFPEEPFILGQAGIRDQLDRNELMAARDSWQQARALYQAIDQPALETLVLNHLGMVYRQLEDYPQAIGAYEASLALARTSGDASGEVTALKGLGYVYLDLGEVDRAASYRDQSLAIDQRAGTASGAPPDRSPGDGVYDALVAYAQALEQQMSAQMVRQQLPPTWWTVTDESLGSIYDALGDNEMAFNYQERSLSTLAGTIDRQYEEQTNRLLTEGIQHYQANDFQAAEQTWQETLTLAQRVNYREGEAGALSNLGTLAQIQGNYRQAADYLNRSLAIAQATNNPQGAMIILNALGNLYYSLGDFGQAMEYQQQSLAIAQTLGDEAGIGAASSGLGIAGKGQGNFTQAIAFHEQALTEARRSHNQAAEAAALSNIGNAYLALGDYPRASDYQQQSLAIATAIADRPSQFYALRNLGNIAYAQASDAQAATYHQQSLDLAREDGDRKLQGLALNSLGLAEFRLGQLAQAETSFRQSMALWEALREGLADAELIAITGIQDETYRNLQKVLIAQHQPAAALEIAERGRAQAFAALLARTRSPGTALPATPGPFSLAQIQATARRHNATLVEYAIQYDTFNIQGRPQLHESELYIWVVSPAGEVTFQSVDLKPLWQSQQTSLLQLVSHSRRALGVGGRGGFEPIDGAAEALDPDPELRQLYQLLIAPIAEVLPTDAAAPVVIIPQGQLFLVPFAALKAETGDYLIQRHTLLSAPAIQVLALMAQQHSQPNFSEALVIGNPTMPVPQREFGEPLRLAPLPGAEREAQAIAAVLNTSALVGSEATETTVTAQMADAGIIHLATHGLLDDFGTGIPGAIALAPDERNDGLLTVDEILKLRLQANLVVLSACDTGQGRITGDGVIGLSRALITAGSSSVVVSLWSVPDVPTAELMTEFYRLMQQGQDKAQALRQAMLATMRTNSDPRDWAAFTLIGAAE